MKSFNKWITIDSSTLNFNFTPVQNPNGKKFFISVLNKEGIIFFEMKEDHYGHWLIVEPVPTWLLPAQPSLEAAIKSQVHTTLFNQ